MAEEVSYDCIALPNHVLGTNIENQSDWVNRNTSVDFCCEPFVRLVLLSACTSIVGLSSQVMILPQRQTAVVAMET